MNINIKKSSKSVSFIFQNDRNNERLKLLVILSPIFIASFDNGAYELEFIKNIIDKSKFPYGLYPNFFSDFSHDLYKSTYKNYEVNEDIYLNDNNEIIFSLNLMDDSYIKSLKALIQGLIINKTANKYFTKYFADIRDDIVINGRRSILANSIQGFYLSKYVVVWMMNLCEYIKDNQPELCQDIIPIYNLSSNLKTIRTH